MEAKQIKIINQAHYHYHEIIGLKNFESKFSEIDRKQALIKRIDDYERICSVMAKKDQDRSHSKFVPYGSFPGLLSIC